MTDTGGPAFPTLADNGHALLRLLSALESVMVYQSTSKALLPDYLLDELHTCAEILEREILK